MKVKLIYIMSEASWDEIQAIKTKRLSIRERMEKRKKERQDILHPTKCYKTDAGFVDDKKSVSDLGRSLNYILSSIFIKYHVNFLEQNRILKWRKVCYKFSRM